MNSANSNAEDMKNKSKKTVKKKKKVEVTRFKDLEGKFLHITVGDKDRPATIEDIDLVQDKIVDLFEENNVNCMAFVTHHAVSINMIEKSQ